MSHRSRTQCGIHAQDLINRHIPEGVRGQTQPSRMGLTGQRQKLVVRHAKHAVRGGVAVRLTERRRGAAESAVGKELHRIDAQMVRATDLRERRDPLALDRAQRHDIDAQRQSPLGIESAVHRQQVRGDTGV